jgi:hypothetical protein
MITSRVNTDAQVIEFVEGGEIVSVLTYGEATRCGFRCDAGVVFRDGNYVSTSVPDVSSMTAERDQMQVTLKATKKKVLVPSLVVKVDGTLLIEIMLPHDFEGS